MVTFLSIGWLLSLLAGGYIILRLQQKRDAAKQEAATLLETEKTLNYFATSMFRQNSVEDILWDVTKNCISRLHFEDCVVYLYNPERNVLVQKAAFGPKNPQQFEILNPLEIAVGSGIVGYVFEQGVAEIIPDTSLDRRYIEDDLRRNSEITVPIIYQGKKFGIIDSEHSRKGFFTENHLQILTTIASLCAIKIEHALQEQAFRSAELKLHDNNRKMAEIRLTSLRTQLNPHFLFNSINSINNFILRKDNQHASLYLNVFSKLIRQIFEYSHSEWITLEKEIKLLELYIQLERLRFENKFSSSISVDDTLNPQQVLIPPLLIQPFVENAIWHGLLYRDGETGELNIRFWRTNERLFAGIEDNGIGREKAARLKEKHAPEVKKSGLALSDERISLMNEMYSSGISYTVSDLIDDQNNSGGTRVVLSMMIKELRNG